MSDIVMAVLCGVSFGLILWAIVRLLQATKSREVIAVAAVMGAIVFVMNLIGGGVQVVGILLATAIAWKALTAVDVTLVVSALAVVSSLTSSIVIRFLWPT